MCNNPPASESVPNKVYNIGNNSPQKLMMFIGTLEKCLSKSLGREMVLEKNFETIKHGDVSATYVSTYRLQEAVGFKPEMTIEEGLQKFADWYV